MNETQSQTESLLEIVKGIDDHNIMLPEFQRDFRWELDKSYDLFDSLIRDIFIGTLIYGKPAFAMTLREIDTLPRKGKGSRAPLQTYDYTKDQIVKLAQTQNLRIVLDGQQRITAIYRAITGLDTLYIILHDHINYKGSQKLSLEEMMLEVRGEENPLAISVKLADAYEVERDGLDDEEINERFARTAFARTALKDADEQQRKAARKIYRRAIYLLIDLYKQQKLVAFYLLDMSLSKFCVFFERSNSRGIQLNFTDILAAKLYHGFNLRKKIEEFESRNTTIHLNREIIIRAIAYLVGTRKGSIDIDRNFILEHLDADDFKEHWDTTCQLYAESLNYLEHQHYILSQSWMPSENMIIPLMMFLRHIKRFDRMHEEQRRFLEYWYWSSIFANRYSSSSNETIIVDCGVLIQVANRERITARNYFMRMRPLITEAADLFSYTKRSSTLYRGILNLLGYASKGLKDWNSTHVIAATMALEDHHIYPRAYIASRPKLVDLDQNEAELLVDCVVNRTLLPKILNIQIGKKAPMNYLSELQRQVNPQLTECLPSHLMPIDMIADETWNSHFKLFLEERAERLFDLIRYYTTEQTPEMIVRYGHQLEGSEIVRIPVKPRLKDMIVSGTVYIGDRIYIKKYPEQVATIVDGETVASEGKHIPINTWGQQITGWTSINIYNYVCLERTQQSLEKLREQGRYVQE
jgi:hypothetical protein